MTAIIGGGGKSTLLHALADELSKHVRVIVATSTKMYVPDWCPVLLSTELGDVESALATSSLVCVGSIHEPTGKLDAPRMAFSDLADIADYVLVEADGAKRLPLKAHTEHEPVIPTCTNRVVYVVGIDGVGVPISQTCHRPELYAQLASASVDERVTPEMVATVLESESLHDVVLINKVETESDWQKAENIAALVKTPVIAGSLWRNEFRCLH